MPRAILNVEKTIVFAVSFNIASSLTDINQRYLMQWCTIWRCSHSANIRSDIFKWGPRLWHVLLQSDKLTGKLVLSISTPQQDISLALVKYIHIYIDNPSSKDQGSNAMESLRVYFHVLLQVLNNKNCPSSPSALSFLSPFHLTVLRHKGPDGKQWQYFYPCAVSAWPVLWPDLMSPRTTFSPPPKSHLGNNLPTVQDPIIMQSY